ncbi:MAG: MBL fold metallo-hydrolase [Acidimicrobiales bacterium]
MCATDDSMVPTAAARESVPREAVGDAVDPIRLEAVDEAAVTILVDNSYDGLLPDVRPATRAHLRRMPTVAAPGFAGGRTTAGLVAEHGFSALVTVRRKGRSHTVLFDAGISPDGLATNMERLALDAGAIEAVVLSHGHFDHVGGLSGLARLRGRAGLPLLVHPLVWTQRRIALPTPGVPAWELPRVDRAAIEAQGFEVIERRQRSLLLDGCLLVTGEVDRTTDFEQGMPGHDAWLDGRWEPDPLILDDQAVVVNVRDQGLVVITGCGHAGAVNIARHALRLTGVDRLHSLIGGFHLSGPAFAPVIEPTISALGQLAPNLVVPGHCTGWVAQHRLAAALPEGVYLPSAVGSVFTVTAN